MAISNVHCTKKYVLKGKLSLLKSTATNANVSNIVHTTVSPEISVVLLTDVTPVLLGLNHQK